MSSFRFVHAADLHLDTQFSGFRPAPAVRDALRDASLAAWDSLVELTLRRGASFLLLAGDIYDGPERGVRAQMRFVRGLERLSSAGIRTFMVHGNHDPLGGWSAVRAWPEGVTVFGAAEVGHVALDGVTVHGLSYPRRDVSENLALRFARGPETGLHIALLHANVGAVEEHAAYSPCTVEDLRAARMDYWALGHVHRHAVLRAHDPWIVYPGCLQGRSPQPGEQGAKGAVVVEVENGRIGAVEFVESDRVRFAGFELDVSAHEDLNLVREALIAASEKLRATNGGRGLLLRATLTGRGRLHADLRRPGAMAGLLAEIREEHQGGDPLTWWDQLTDETRPDLDIAAIRARGDFAAELLDVADELAGNASRLAGFLDARLRPLEGARIPRDVSLPADGDELDRAVRLALDHLEDESGDA